MTNLQAMIMTNNGIGGTIHQFARAFNLSPSDMNNADMFELAQSGAYGVSPASQFLRKASMNKRGMQINGKPFTVKYDITA